MTSCKMEQPGLYAGFGKVDITPDYPCGLAGYGRISSRMHDSVAEPIYATCIALTEGIDTILVYTVDVLSIRPNHAASLRAHISTAVGIPQEKIFLTATHTHSAPSWYGHENVDRWLTDLHKFLAQAAALALSDRSPATVFAGRKQLPGMNFVRHYLTANGTYAGSNFGTFKDNPAVAYACAPDDTLGLVEFRREKPQKNILMINWQGHPDRAKQLGITSIAPSYVGPLRDTLSANTGCLVAFFTGADGNMNTDSRIEKDKLNLNWREYGVKIALQAYETYKELEPVEGSGIAVTRRQYEAEIDHSWDHMVDIAKKINELFQKEGRDVANIEAKKYNLTSPYQAGAIVDRSKMGKSRPTELSAFRVGNLGFVCCEYEMFSEAGIYIKENSPFPVTMVLTTNYSYIPSRSAYEYRSYEADTSHFTPGISERLAETMVNMLKEIQ